MPLYINPDNENEAVLQCDCAGHCVGLDLWYDDDLDHIFGSPTVAPYWQGGFWARLRSAWIYWRQGWRLADDLIIAPQTRQQLVDWLGQRKPSGKEKLCGNRGD